MTRSSTIRRPLAQAVRELTRVGTMAPKIALTSATLR